MRAKELKEILTEEHIMKILEKLGADYVPSVNSNELMFRTVCHAGSSHKLYFYRDSLLFHCYSNCGQMDIINVVENTFNINIQKAILYICNIIGISNSFLREGFDDECEPDNRDLLILNREYKQEEVVDMNREFEYVNEKVLDFFYKMYHPLFYKDGISIETMYKFGLRYDILNQRIIIPHRDEFGNIIAIRCRNTFQDLIDAGRKYTPIVFDGKLLSAPTGRYFYGQYYNGNNIRVSKKAILLESEKAVMQLDSILKGGNIGLALSSSSLSLVQVELLKELGVEEVIIGLDKEYLKYGTDEEKVYAIKIKKGIINKLAPYFTVSVMWDKNDLLMFKDSPTDRGKEVFYELYKNRIKV